MNRRGFLTRLGTGLAAYALSRQLSGILPVPPMLRTPQAEPVVELRVGDTFTIAGKYQMNPQTRMPQQPLTLKQFVITGHADSDG